VSDTLAGIAASTMNKELRFPLLALLGLLAVVPARAQIITDNAILPANLAVPDNDTVGVSSTLAFNSAIEDITDVNVWLNLSGGWNGDLFVSLEHDSGLAVLLNRVGRRTADLTGYSDAGFDVTLDDQAANGDVHLYRLTLFGNANKPLTGALTGAWAPDGRPADPLLALDTSPRTDFLSSFNGLNPNGAWTLVVKDVSPGDTSTLVSWGIEVTGIVPEPAAAWLLLLGVPGLLWLRRRA